MDSLVDSVGASSEGGGGGTGTPEYVPPRIALVQPPSWRTHANSDRDVLQDVSMYTDVMCCDDCLFAVASGACDSDQSRMHI